MDHAASTSLPRPPRVLVVAASRHGSTAEIATALARSLQQSAAGGAAGLTAAVESVEHRPDPALFDAVVLGSAVYAGEPPFPPDEPYDADPVSQLIGAREHRVFPGRLHEHLLGFGERAMVTAMRTPTGDFRDWDAVRGWAEQVADELVAICSAASAPAAPAR